MPDVYATIADTTADVQERLADVIEMRAADPRHQAMLQAYLSEIALPRDARVLEIGCGTGAVTRTLAARPGVAHAIGVDPSPVFVARARALSQGVRNIAFEQGDGRALALEREAFDAVVVHTTLSHVPRPDSLLAEAFRVLRPGGTLAVFDGDYSTATLACGEFDPLQACADAFRANFVHDAWLVRRLPKLIRAAGFDVAPMRSHGYVEAPVAAYMMTWVERGADALVAAGRIGRETAEALKAEGRRRNEAHEWFGHIAFASVLGRKPV